MIRHTLGNIWHLGLKELSSLRYDPVLLAFLIFSFSFMLYSRATGITHELRNASVSIVDEDRSQLSGRIAQALLPPSFRPPRLIERGQIDRRMDQGIDTFVLDIPPKFQADVEAGRAPAIQLNVDATAVLQAGIGTGYIESIVGQEVARFLPAAAAPEPPVILRPRVAFNSNLESSWFMGVVALVDNITELTIILAGAAIIREREHGTLDHLLVMPLSPFEIAMGKVWANGLVIAVATGLSLLILVEGILGLPSTGSFPLFMLSVAAYLFFGTAVGLLLGTIARTMPQFGLMMIMVVLPLILLSGGNTPLESMPKGLQTVMLAVPSTHFVKIAQAILFRGAGLDVVWPNLLAVAGVGGLLFTIALLRFRRAIAQ